MLLISKCSCCQSVKVLSYLEPQNPEYVQFVENLKTDAKKMFNFTIEDSLVCIQMITNALTNYANLFCQPKVSLCICQYNLIAGGFYDGVMLYSQALNETLSEEGPRTGPVQRLKVDVVTPKMWNRTFPGEDRCLSFSSAYSGHILGSHGNVQ